ncbi:hypothetical protein ACB092_03G053700 [Castanea dentata]
MPKGVFQRHSLDVTDILHPDGQNLLAFPVHLPDHPGRISHKGEHGGDHEIGKDVATQYVLGWDWMAPKRDRNTGIWDEVSVSITRMKMEQQHLQHFCDSKHPLDYRQDYRGGDTCCGCQEPVYGPSYWFTRGGWPKYIIINHVLNYPLASTIPCTHYILLFSFMKLEIILRKNRANVDSAKEILGNTLIGFPAATSTFTSHVLL